jgi:hypothetical protein
MQQDLSGDPLHGRKCGGNPENALSIWRMRYQWRMLQCGGNQENALIYNAEEL